jgi:hypothetical protein
MSKIHPRPSPVICETEESFAKWVSRTKPSFDITFEEYKQFRTLFQESKTLEKFERAFELLEVLFDTLPENGPDHKKSYSLDYVALFDDSDVGYEFREVAVEKNLQQLLFLHETLYEVNWAYCEEIEDYDLLVTSRSRSEKQTANRIKFIHEQLMRYYGLKWQNFRNAQRQSEKRGKFEIDQHPLPLLRIAGKSRLGAKPDATA